MIINLGCELLATFYYNKKIVILFEISAFQHKRLSLTAYRAAKASTIRYISGGGKPMKETQEGGNNYNFLTVNHQYS